MHGGLYAELRDWLEDRAGLRRAKRIVLDEALPQNVGWLQTLGRVASLIFVLVGVTGVFLAMNYSSSPDHALQSIQFINQLPGGSLVRGLHVYGGSALFVLVCLHMLRVFVHGAYKRPREITWMLGIALLLLVVGFLFTGDPLPWDQKAYWTVRVRAGYANGLPLLGPYVKRLMLGGETQGAPTLARFFIVHVFVLPALLAPLIFVHVALVRRKGMLSPGTEEPDEPQVERRIPYYPYQAFKDVTVTAIVVAVVFALSHSLGVYTEGPPDPAAQDYVPRPEWYFLPLFKLVKLQFGSFLVFGGSRTWIATALIPNLVIGFLILLPFLDRNPSRLLRNRLFAISGALVFILVTLALGTKGKMETDEEIEHLRKTKPGTRSEFTGLARIGEALFRKKCANCHRLGAGSQKKSGPDLVRLVAADKGNWQAEELIFFLINPNLTYPNTIMPPARKLKFTLDDLDAMAEYFTQARFKKSAYASPTVAKTGATSATTPKTGAAPGKATIVPPVPTAVPAGAGPGFPVFVKECVRCHQFNGVGGKAGMPQFITGKNPRSRDWIVKLLQNPGAVFKDTAMPAAEAKGAQFNALVDFVMTVKVGKFDPKKAPAGAPPMQVVVQTDPKQQKRIDELAKENAALKGEVAKLKAGSQPPPVVADLPPLAPEAMTKAVGLFNTKCRRCHLADGVEGISGGGLLGPKFANGRSPRTKDDLLHVIEDPRAVFGEDTIMPPTMLADPRERDALAEFMLRLKLVPKQ